MSPFVALNALMLVEMGLAGRAIGNHTVIHEDKFDLDNVRGVSVLPPEATSPSLKPRRTERFHVAAKGKIDSLEPVEQPTSLLQEQAVHLTDLPEGAQCCQVKKAVIKDAQTRSKLEFNSAITYFQEGVKNSQAIVPLMCHQGKGATCKAASNQWIQVNLVWVEFEQPNDSPKIGSMEHAGGGLDGFSTDITEIEDNAAENACSRTTPHCNSIDLWDAFLSDYNTKVAGHLNQDVPEFTPNLKAEAPLISISTANSFDITGGLFERKFKSAVTFAGKMGQDTEHTPPTPSESLLHKAPTRSELINQASRDDHQSGFDSVAIYSQSEGH